MRTIYSSGAETGAASKSSVFKGLVGTT